MEDDDYFSDDGFEDLPPGTLWQLEQTAYQATRAQHPPAAPEPPRPVDQTPAAERSDISARFDTSLRPPAHLHTGLTSEYGALDMGELDAQVVDAETGQSALGQPPIVADDLVPPEQFVDEHQVFPPPPAINPNWALEQMEVEEPDIPQHIHEDFSLRVQKVRNRLGQLNDANVHSSLLKMNASIRSLLQPSPRQRPRQGRSQSSGRIRRRPPRTMIDS